jgi:hypothetical protein
VLQGRRADVGAEGGPLIVVISLFHSLTVSWGAVTCLAYGLRLWLHGESRYGLTCCVIEGASFWLKETSPE